MYRQAGRQASKQAGRQAGNPPNLWVRMSRRSVGSGQAGRKPVSQHARQRASEHEQPTTQPTRQPKHVQCTSCIRTTESPPPNFEPNPVGIFQFYRKSGF